MNQKKFSLRARAQSFVYAWHGLKALVATEHNSYIHAVFTIAALALASLFRVTATEWILLFFAMALVWLAELFNTAIEKTADLISNEQHPQIKLIKDLAAAAVLVAAIAAISIGGIIFIPYFFKK